MNIKEGRKPHFFWAHNAIFDEWGTKLKGNGIAVYLCLVRHANNEGTCYPSLNTIAKKCGICRNTVIRTIDKLVELGLIVRERREGPNNQKERTSNLYTIVDISEVEVGGVVQQMHYPSANVDIREVQGGVVQPLHYPSANNALPLVQPLHYPSAGDGLEGNTLKETYIKETTTTTEVPKSLKTKTESKLDIDNKKRSSSSSNELDNNTTNLPNAVKCLSTTLKFDFALQELPKEQMQSALKILHDVPITDKQLILDELNTALSQKNIKSPIHYLNTLVKRYHEGDFIPTSDLFAQRTKPTKNTTNNANTCKYCKGTGQIRFIRQDGTLTELIDCKHGQLANNYIQTVKEEYGYDLQPHNARMPHQLHLSI